MSQSRNPTNRLTLYRELESSFKKAVFDNYSIATDEAKLHLLRKAQETQVPDLLKKFWKLEYNCDLPSDEELLQSPVVKELWNQPALRDR